MQLPTVRIDLGNGAYAVACKEVKRVTARLHEAELRKHMTPKGGATISLSEVKVGDDLPTVEYELDLAAVDPDAVNEIYILNQVTEWSFGPVDRETLDNGLTEANYKALVKELDRLYKPVPLSG